MDTSVPNPPSSQLFYKKQGYCPICENQTAFVSESHDFRDKLDCAGCNEQFHGSVVRERALARCLEFFVPDYRELRVHDVAPVMRGISLKLSQQCPSYLHTNYFPDALPGEIVRGTRNENMEAQTFPDEVFDLVISLDVMEHVNRPDLAFREVARTLVNGGHYIFSAPTYKNLVQSRRRALYHDDRVIEHLETPPEYHGNPISSNGSLVTFHYGYDLVEKINEWAGMNVTCLRFWDESIGVIGPFTEIYVCRKPQ